MVSDTSGLDRHADWLPTECNDLSHLRSKRDGCSPAIFPVEAEVIVAETHEPALLQVEGKGGSDDHVIHVWSVRGARIRNWILYDRPGGKILDAGIHQGHRWTGLPFANTQRSLRRRRKNQRWAEAPTSPGLLNRDEIEKLQVAYTL